MKGWPGATSPEVTSHLKKNVLKSSCRHEQKEKRQSGEKAEGKGAMKGRFFTWYKSKHIMVKVSATECFCLVEGEGAAGKKR